MEKLSQGTVLHLGVKGLDDDDDDDDESTPRSRILLEKLTPHQLVKKFPAFYGP